MKSMNVSYSATKSSVLVANVSTMEQLDTNAAARSPDITGILDHVSASLRKMRNFFLENCVDFDECVSRCKGGECTDTDGGYLCICPEV